MTMRPSYTESDPHKPLNCDQAFDLMTDASCDDCAALHAHLDECARCQQMYETLSPALGMFAAERTSVGDAYSADDGATSVQIAERVAIRLTRSPRQPAPSRHWRRSLLSGVVVLIFGLGAMLGAAGWLSPTSAPVPEGVAQCHWVNRDAAPTGQRADAVVLSCMACHLSSAAE